MFFCNTNFYNWMMAYCSCGTDYLYTIFCCIVFYVVDIFLKPFSHFNFRLRVTKLLLVGLGGLGSEVCKNIVLAGIKAITLMDDQKITEEDFFSQFLVTRDDLGKNVSRPSVTLHKNYSLIYDIHKHFLRASTFQLTSQI